MFANDKQGVGGGGVRTLFGADRMYRLASIASGFTSCSDSPTHRHNSWERISEPTTVKMVAVTGPGISRARGGSSSSGGGTLRV